MSSLREVSVCGEVSGCTLEFLSAYVNSLAFYLLPALIFMLLVELQRKKEAERKRCQWCNEWVKKEAKWCVHCWREA